MATDNSKAQASVAETRGAQMYPTLSETDIGKLCRFGEVRQFGDGEMLARIGEAGLGIAVVLSGAVEISRADAAGDRIPIVTHLPGAFLGEIAQLSGRPALVDAKAIGAVRSLSISPERLRALMVAEAELGERIMRALILRRVGLIETGAGPVIVGRAASGDVLRLSGFLTRNGHPHLRLDPDEDPDAHILLDRFEVGADQLPIVICPGGEMLRNPSEGELARCIGLVGRIDGDRLYDVAIVGAGPAGL